MIASQHIQYTAHLLHQACKENRHVEAHANTHTIRSAFCECELAYVILTVRQLYEHLTDNNPAVE